MNQPASKRILFVAENVTTAQVSLLATLARSLPPDRYEVTFACSEFDPTVFDQTGFARREIHSLPRRQLLESVAAGRQLYDLPALKQYVAEELDLLSEVRPDLVVANHRPSLTVSAPLSGVALATVISAHYSPFAVRTEFPVPDHPTVKLVGPELARRFLSRALPAAFSLLARPVNALRQQHGLAAIGDLLHVMTWGDLTLYPDLPALAPTRGLPGSHHYLGPVRWSAPVPLPSWWNDLDPDRPTVYLTLGSSGNLEAWPALAQGLGALPVNVILSTAGRVGAARLPPNFWAADWLPGAPAARRASMAITNGGSGSSLLALAQGTPVIGVASNLDQHLSMAAIERAGAGRVLRAGSLTASQVKQAVGGMLGSDAELKAARRLAPELEQWDPAARFMALVDQTTHELRARATA